jgi:hypothetical protein
LALPAEFWDLHTAARLYAVGEKARPIACGDALRRLFGRLFCQQPKNKARSAALLEGAGQLGVGTRGGAERVALQAQLVYEAGGMALAIDGTNAFNALSRSALLGAVAEHMPHLYPYVATVYGPGSTPVLQFGMEGSELAEPVPSRQGVHQGDPLGPLLFALSVLPVMQSFRAQFPEMGLPAYLDDMTILFLPPRGDATSERALVRLKAAFDHVAEGLGAVGVAVNTTKSVCLLPAGVDLVAAKEALGVPVAGDGIALLDSEQCNGSAGLTLMGVPIGSTAYVQAAVRSKLRDPSTDRLLAEVARMEDAHVAFTLLRLCVPARATYLARGVPPALLLEELHRYDATVLCALAALLQEPPAHASGPEGGGGLPLPGGGGLTAWEAALEEVRCPLWDGVVPVALTPAQQAQAQLRQRHGGLGVASIAHRAPAAFLGRTVETLGPALRALPPALRAQLRAHNGRRLLSSSTMEHAHAALEHVRACGAATADALPELLPPEWADSWAPPQAAAAGHGPAAAATAAANERLVDLLLPEEAAGAAGVQTRRSAATSGGDAAVPARRPAGVYPHRQAALARHLDVQAAQQCQQAMCDAAGPPGTQARARTLARYRSQADRGSMAWVGALPSFPHLTMTGPLFRETGRRALGIERRPCGGLCPAPSCSSELDGVHARRCPRLGGHAIRHNKVRDALVARLQHSLRLAGVKTEQRHPFVGGGDPNRRMDIVIAGGVLRLPPTAHEPQGGGARDACIDVTIVDGTRDVHCEAAAKDIGTVLTKASLDKFKTYGFLLDRRRSTLYPAAFDQFGAMCTEVHSLLRVFARHECAAPSAQPCRGAYARCLSQWRQCLSVTLQRAVSQSVFEAWGGARPGSTGAPADVSAYATARFLAPRPPPAVRAAAAAGPTGVG